MFNQLKIQNYRCFQDFSIKDLARLNLIVGPNNSGKTSLLEAVYLLVEGEEGLLPLLYNRGEFVESTEESSSGHINRVIKYQISHIFRGRLVEDKRVYIESGAACFNVYHERIGDEFERSETHQLTLEFRSLKEIRALADWQVGRYMLDEERTVKLERPVQSHRLRSFLTTSHLSVIQLAELWDTITLTPKEDNVVAALQILEPDVERISFTSRRTLTSGILVKLRHQSKPVPLGSMGDGMRRILTLAMSIAVAEKGVLLVDEIDTGLYYRTQADVWKLLMDTAKRLDVQVFATTHSLDCVQAFQEALNQSSDSSEGKLIRMSLRGKQIQAVPYTAEELAIAARQAIEVR
jgi:predicted ATP-dependent endonuclease of OLD family